MGDLLVDDLANPSDRALSAPQTEPVPVSSLSGNDRFRYGPDLDLFASRLKDVRTLRKMSLQDVADASGFTKSHVWELENGSSRNPTVRAVWSLSKALCVSPAWLLGLDHEVMHLDPLVHQVAALINVELERRSKSTRDGYGELIRRDA